MLNRKDVERLGKGVIRLLTLGVFVLLTFGQVFAQDQQPNLTDPNTVFSPDIKVIQAKADITHDNKARIFLYLNPIDFEWKKYPYPPELKDNLTWSFPYTDGKYLFLIDQLNWMGQYNDYHDIGAENFWMFDITSGELTRPPQQCGRVQATPGNGIWVVHKEQNGLTFCNTETGVTTSILPQTFTADELCLLSFYPIHYGDTQPTASPDGKWLVFHTCTPNTEIYSYEIKTGQINHLGSVTDIHKITIHSWFDDTNVIFDITTDTSLKSPIQTYIVDAAQVDSLSYIGSNTQFNTTKFFWKESVSPNTTGGSIVIHSYDMVTKIRNRLLSYDCKNSFNDCSEGVVMVNKAGTRIALTDNPPDTYSKALSVYNIASQKPIYEFKAGIGRSSQVAWADDNTLIYFDETLGKTTTLHLVKFGDEDLVNDEIISGSFENPFIEDTLSSDGKRLVIVDRNQVQIESVSTGQIKVIAQVNDENAHFVASWHDNNDLSVLLDCCNFTTAHRWLVKVPDGLLAE